MKKVILILVGIAAGVIFICAGGIMLFKKGSDAKDKEQAAKVQEEKPLEVVAAVLLSDYKGNEPKADITYKGKVVQVSGIIHRITNNAVELKGGEYELLTVDCEFDDASVMASLSANSYITIKGICDGKSFASIKVKNCKIVK